MQNQVQPYWPKLQCLLALRSAGKCRKSKKLSFFALTNIEGELKKVDNPKNWLSVKNFCPIIIKLYKDSYLLSK